MPSPKPRRFAGCCLFRVDTGLDPRRSRRRRSRRRPLDSIAEAARVTVRGRSPKSGSTAEHQPQLRRCSLGGCGYCVRPARRSAASAPVPGRQAQKRPRGFHTRERSGVRASGALVMARPRTPGGVRSAQPSLPTPQGIGEDGLYNETNPKWVRGPRLGRVRFMACPLLASPTQVAAFKSYRRRRLDQTAKRAARMRAESSRSSGRVRRPDRRPGW